MAWAKRLSSKIAKERKAKGKFIVASRGPHKRADSLPLLVVLRDSLAVAETHKEGKQSIKRGEMMVDGKVCKDHKLGVGLMDTIHIPLLSVSYRVMNGKKGPALLKIPENQSRMKICKITGKTVVNGGKIQYNLHDGRNIISDRNYGTKDSLVISLPEQKVVEHLKFEEGSLGLITTGKNAGTVAKIEKIESGKVRRVWLKKKGDSDFETPLDYVMIVGKEKPAIAVE